MSCSGWLKADAERNIDSMSLTLDVSRFSGWLKIDVTANILLMSVTLDVSQLEMSALKFCKGEKRERTNARGVARLARWQRGVV